MLMEVEYDNELGGEVPPDIEGFNCLVDLCGIFKKTSVYEVKSLLFSKFGTGKFKYTYHIDPIEGGERVHYLDSDNVQVWPLTQFFLFPF